MNAKDLLHIATREIAYRTETGAPFWKIIYQNV